ncbi:MAG: DUF6350 family protein [Actinomycetia bacterium]|nr:DUF6350 family protein [Actinomycetes bacterium]
MSPLDLLRRVTHPGPATREHPSRGTAGREYAAPSLVRGAGHGGLAALITLAPVLLLASLLWLTTADMALAWHEAVLAGTSFWLLGHGVPITVSNGIIGIVPLGALVLVLVIGIWSAGRATWAAAEFGYRSALRAALAWSAGYAVLMLAAGALSLLGPMGSDIPRWLAATLLLPPVMAISGMVRSLNHDDVDEFLERCRVPAALRRAWRPALHVTAVILIAGTLAAIVAIVLSFDDVSALHRDLRPGVAGGTILLLLQVLALPNIGVWIASFVAGPGFSIIDGASVNWDHISTSLVPNIPVLAAHPDAVILPDATPLLAASLVALGGWLGWQSLAATARLASLWAKTATVLSAAITTGALIAALDWIGGGSLGLDRLAGIGAPSGLLGLALTGWLLLGALAVLIWDWRTLEH